MKNQVIEVLNVEHGKRVIDYWKSRGIDTRDFIGRCTKENKYIYRYYGVINEYFNNYSLEDVNGYNAEIITLPEKTFPRKMLVWNDNEGNAVEQVVLWINPFGKCIYQIFCVHPCSEIDFNKGEKYYIHTWKHAKELPEESNIVEMTMEEVCKVLGKTVKIIK